MKTSALENRRALFLTIALAGVLGIAVLALASAAHGGGRPTVTEAESVADTSGPTGGVPIAVATLVKLAITFATVQL